MSASIMNNFIQHGKKLVVFVQPSLGICQMLDFLIYWHKFSQGVAPFGNDNLFTAVRDPSENFRKMLLGFCYIHSLLAHLYLLVECAYSQDDLFALESQVVGLRFKLRARTEMGKPGDRSKKSGRAGG